jgi:hypothetical protein
MELTKAEIWKIKTDIEKCISLFERGLERDEEQFPFWDNLPPFDDIDKKKFPYWYDPCFDDIDKRISTLTGHVIDTDDYELGKELACYRRSAFLLATRKWNSDDQVTMVWTQCAILLKDVESWIKEAYYKLPYDEFDNYYMKDGKLLHVESKIEYIVESKIEPVNEPATVELIQLPDNLLQALQEKGYIEDALAKPLKWIKSKSLLAYFVEVANDNLNLKNGIKRQIQPFEQLFNVKGITTAINNYKKTGDLPVGYKGINNLFKSLLL